MAAPRPRATADALIAQLQRAKALVEARRGATGAAREVEEDLACMEPHWEEHAHNDLADALAAVLAQDAALAIAPADTAVCSQAGSELCSVGSGQVGSAESSRAALTGDARCTISTVRGDSDGGSGEVQPHTGAIAAGVGWHNATAAAPAKFADIERLRQ